MSSVTVGRVLPTVTTTDDELDLPDVSVTFSCTVNVPLVVNVWVGLAAGDLAEPSAKAHSEVGVSPSGSSEPSLENLTVSGVTPESLSDEAFATGVREPLT